jgi:putative holliday junction resolvase
MTNITSERRRLDRTFLRLLLMESPPTPTGCFTCAREHTGFLHAPFVINSPRGIKFGYTPCVPCGQSRSFSHRRIVSPTAALYRRALAVDYGLKRVGMAVSVGIAPRPLPCYHHNASPEEAAKAVAAVANGACARDIVVGLPLTGLGREGEQAIATRLFADALVTVAPWARICLVDERFTTQEARASLIEANVSPARMPGLIDSASAALIAERFFAEPPAQGHIVLHDPPPKPEIEPGYCAGVETTSGGATVERESFFAWRRNSMARAAEQAAELKEKHKKRRQKRK